MKIKIRQYLLGGGVLASIYLPVLTTPGALGASAALYAINLLNSGTVGGESSKSSTSDKGGITEKDLYTGLYKTIAELGLLSDSQYIINQLQEDLFNDSLTNPFGDTSDLTGKYLKALSYVNMAKSNLKLYDEAYKEAVSKNSLQETAVTSDGKVVVKAGDGQITMISPELYRKNPGNYTLMTNGNLLAERMNNPKMAFLNGVFGVVLNSTSVKEIMETIDLFIKDLGSNEDNILGYTRKDIQQILGGLSLLSIAASKYGSEQVADMIKEGGLYKIGITSQELTKLAQMAITAILQALPENQKTLLKVKSDGTDKGLLATISLLVNKNNTNKFSFTPELLKEKTDSSSEGSDSEGTSKIKLGPEEQYYLGLGNKDTITFLNKTLYAFTVKNAVSRTLTNENGKAVGISTADALSHSTYTNLFYLNLATLGGQRISPEALHNIVIDGNIVSAVLPIDVDAKNNLNILKPDFEHLKKLEEADKLVKDAGIDTSIIAQALVKLLNGLLLNAQEKQLLLNTIQKINKIYKDNGLSLVYDSMGNLTAQYHRFTLVNAKAPEGVFSRGMNWETSGLEEITDPTQIDNILDVINKDRGEKHLYDFNKKGWLGIDNTWLFDYDKMFSGVLFIPMKESFIDAYTDTLNPALANMIDAQEQFNVRLLGGFKE